MKALSKLNNLNFCSGAFTGPTAAACIAVGYSVQGKPVSEGTIVGLTGNAILGAGAGLIKSLLNCAFYCSLDKETRATTVFKFVDGLIKAALLWTSSFTAPLLGEVILNYGTRYTEIIAAQWIGIGIFCGAALSLGLCCLITVGCFSVCLHLPNLVTSLDSHSSRNFNWYENSRAQRQVVYVPTEPSNPESVSVQPLDIVDDSAHVAVFVGPVDTDLTHTPRTQTPLSADQEKSQLSSTIPPIVPSLLVKASLLGTKSKDDPRWVPEPESSHSSSFDCPSV